METLVEIIGTTLKGPVISEGQKRPSKLFQKLREPFIYYAILSLQNKARASHNFFMMTLFISYYASGSGVILR